MREREGSLHDVGVGAVHRPDRGPGSGKSTLIDHLQGRGYGRSQEAGRGINQDQVGIGGRALPWADPALFAELMLCWEMRSYRIAAEQTAPVFFDRGVPDIVGYLKLEGLPVPDHLHAAAQRFRYHRRVFIAPLAGDLRTGQRAQAVLRRGRTHLRVDGRDIHCLWLRTGTSAARPLDVKMKG